MTTTTNTRAVLLARQGNRTAWTWDGQVAICETAPTWPAVGVFPQNARWECSLAHWDRYFAAVHEPAGWTRAD